MNSQSNLPGGAAGSQDRHDAHEDLFWRRGNQDPPLSGSAAVGSQSISAASQTSDSASPSRKAPGPTITPSEGDKILKASENLKEYSRQIEERELRSITGRQVKFEERNPHDILRQIAVPPFDYDDVPPAIAELAYYYSEATGFDRTGVIVAATVAAAAMIHDEYRLEVRPESKWYESPRLWAVMIGTPASGKTPSQRAAIGPIKAIHDAGWSKYADECESVPTGEERPDPPPTLYTSDATIPALSEVLKNNPRGVLMEAEEFSSWIGAIDSTDRGEAATNRGNWLNLYDGGSRQINRISRGAVFVPNWSASVLAGCTPDGLRSHMKQLPDDGLIHRFMPAIMNQKSYRRQGDAGSAMQRWGDILRDLYNHTQNGTVKLCPEARQLFDDEDNRKSELSDAVNEASPQLASHLGKHGGMLARVALTFHALVDPDRNLLQAATLRMSIRFCRKVEKHAAAMFNGILSTSTALTLARALARSIAAEGNSLSIVSRTWMSDHCQEFKKAEDKNRREAMMMLVDADWLEPNASARAYGGWPTEYKVHPRIKDLFAEQGEEWRKRRRWVKEAIGLGE